MEGAEASSNIKKNGVLEKKKLARRERKLRGEKLIFPQALAWADWGGKGINGWEVKHKGKTSCSSSTEKGKVGQNYKIETWEQGRACVKTLWPKRGRASQGDDIIPGSIAHEVKFWKRGHWVRLSRHQGEEHGQGRMAENSLSTGPRGGSRILSKRL